MTAKITKILIANRGEIAVRVIKACRELGIATVAVYSEVDRKALHVLTADQAVEIGPAAPLKSYLNIEKLIEVARTCRCDAVHPGYGFLAENPQFARRCREKELIFIGPSPEAMETVGNKLTARRAVQKAGVPLIPGMEEHSHELNKVQQHAAALGYPIMLKASAGGGGKGMRIVRKASELPSALEAGRREALAAFGDDRLYIEKFIQRPRHVEFQVLADQNGNIIHLFERECSIQRRHQKIIEETPSPALDDSLRRKMGEEACRVMQAVQYNNAGTVEFLLDQDKNFYFLEVNARIQVEHPVTELVTGVDLVKQQIRIAGGKPLTFQQEDIHQRGHAIECRIYAEDPENQFFPSVGKLHYVKEPGGPGIRCDSGIYSGLEITHHYDPVLSKLISWDNNRDHAIQKMLTALSDYVILGVKTPIPFLRDLLAHPDFISGNLSTDFIEEHFREWKYSPSETDLNLALMIAAHISPQRRKTRAVFGTDQPPTPWQEIGEWEMFS